MVLGKPAMGDIKAGVITCPVLYAAEEHPSLLPMIQRKFRSPGDVDHAIRCVQNSRGIVRAQELAQGYIDQAIACVELLPAAQSPHAALARQALLDLCSKIINRKK
jgi:geranyl diphosphate synthase